MKLIKLLAWTAVVGTLWLAQAALADDVGGSANDPNCGESVTAEILVILLEAGNINQAQYEALCRKARGEETRQTAAAPAPDVGAEPPRWRFTWDKSFKLDREDGAFKLQFGGRAQIDTALITLQNDLRDAFIDAGIDPRNGTGVEARRARFYFSGTVYDRVFFKAQYDFAQPEDDDNPDFKDVYVGLKKLGPVGEVRVGHFKEPMLLQEWTSSKYLTFMERGLNDVFFPGRNMGMMAAGNAFEQALLWQAGIFRNTNTQAFAFDAWGEEDWHLAGRLVGVPIYRDEGAQLLHLGASYIHRFLDEDAGGNLRFRRRPESHLAQRFVDTGSFPASGEEIFNVELSGVYGPFSLQSEYTNSWVNGALGQADVHFWGIYAYASYFLTGESRKYDFGNGRFGRLQPFKNFNPAKGNWGAWEIAARYSYLDLTNRDVMGGELWDITAALNWYLYPNLRWMLNYVHGDVRNRITDGQGIGGSGDIFEMRFQVEF